MKTIRNRISILQLYNQIITPSTNNLKNGMAASEMAQPAHTPPFRTSIFWLHNPTIAPLHLQSEKRHGYISDGSTTPPPSKSNKFYKLTVIKLQAPTFISIGMYYPSFIPEKNHPATTLRDGSMPPPMTQNNGSGKIEIIQLLTCNFICIVMYYPPLIPEIISLLPPSGVALRRMAEKKIK